MPRNTNKYKRKLTKEKEVISFSKLDSNFKRGIYYYEKIMFIKCRSYLFFKLIIKV